MKYKIISAFTAYFTLVFFTLLFYQVNNPTTKMIINITDPKSITWYDAKIINDKHETAFYLKEKKSNKWSKLVSLQKEDKEYISILFGVIFEQNSYFDNVVVDIH